MKHFYTLAIIFLAFSSAHGQTGQLLDRTQSSLSPSESDYNRFVDMDTGQQQQLYSNPAFYEMLYRNGLLYHPMQYKSILSTGYSQGKKKGDYLLAEGNEYSDYRIMGNGEYSIPTAGTLFGSIQYARGKHSNIGWSTIRHPELYQPYVTTDTIGGDYHYEDYQASGGYSFRLGEWYMGAHAWFQGEQAYRKTDPRALNNTTWLGFEAGVGKLFHNHLLMFQAGYERNKQHVTLRFWRPGEQQRFLVAYGFGLYDVHQSTISFGYSRMYYINQGNAALTYLSPQDKLLSFYAHLAYKFHHVMTEESSTAKNLYYSHIHQFEPTLRIDYRLASSLSLSLQAEGEIEMKKGHENIFDQYLVDENYYIYDYRLIDTQQNYSCSKYSGNVRLKADYTINPTHKVHILGGVALSNREEKYKSDYKIKNQAIYPHAGIGYRLNHKRSELELNGTYIYKHLLDNEYNVDMENTSIEHLDFQHAFCPYAYYNSTYSSINLSAVFQYRLTRGAVGVNLKLMYKTGERDKNTTYTSTIGFANLGAPMLFPVPDKHDELWGSAGIFYAW